MTNCVRSCPESSISRDVDVTTGIGCLDNFLAAPSIHKWKSNILGGGLLTLIRVTFPAMGPNRPKASWGLNGCEVTSSFGRSNDLSMIALCLQVARNKGRGKGPISVLFPCFLVCASLENQTSPFRFARQFSRATTEHRSCAIRKIDPPLHLFHLFSWSQIISAKTQDIRMQILRRTKNKWKKCESFPTTGEFCYFAWRTLELWYGTHTRCPIV